MTAYIGFMLWAFLFTITVIAALIAAVDAVNGNFHLPGLTLTAILVVSSYYTFPRSYIWG